MKKEIIIRVVILLLIIILGIIADKIYFESVMGSSLPNWFKWLLLK